MSKILFFLFVSVFLLGYRYDTRTNLKDVISCTVENDTIPRRAEVLFLGKAGTDPNSGRYAPWLSIALFKAGINLTYTTDTNDISEDNLTKYDGLIIYANYDKISSAKEKALKEFVESGKGLIALHHGIRSFSNSAWYKNAIGAQVKSEKTGVFRARIPNKTHPVMQGIAEFATLEKAFSFSAVNKDVTILQDRMDGNVKQPWTWIRNQGKGRVFYTNYGFNDSTWTNLGFFRLVRNGVSWAIGDQVRTQIARLNIPNVDIYKPEFANYSQPHVVPKVQEALTPEESLKLTQIPPEFEIKLFASEPNITNPIAMSWDERGRLWIVESVDYPNTFLETDGAANDRIKICEDTNGDGKADKFTVFADKLNIPTSIVFCNGGIIVSMAPHFVFLKDTDGDDKADVRENIITGWGKADTHAGPSNLTYGLDNKIWGVVGYSGFDGVINGRKWKFTQGLYSFSPNVKDFEFLATTTNNTWGLGLSEDNNVFLSTANNIHSAYYSIPAKLVQRSLPANIKDTTGRRNQGATGFQSVQNIQGHAESHTMTPSIRQIDVIGGFTSAAGHHLYTARSFPKEYWNRVAFVNEPTVRLVHRGIIEPQGAGFTERDDWNFLASSDEWVGPVQSSVGPDGAVWIADWYSFIIQHNVSSAGQPAVNNVLPSLYTQEPKWGQGNAFITPLRDLEKGRIYRVTYKKAKPYTPVSLSKNDLNGLLKALESDNMFWRITAQRLIVENKKVEAVPALLKLVANQEMDEIGLNNPAAHALWTLHGLGVLDGSNKEVLRAAEKALSNSAPGVRKAALAVLPKDAALLDLIKQANMLSDPNLNVRMHVLLAIASLPISPEAGKLLYEASLNSQNEQDKWLSNALFAAALKHENGFIEANLKNERKSSLSDLSLANRILKAINEEIYPLSVSRRGSAMIFSPDVTNKEIMIKGTITKSNAAARPGNTSTPAKPIVPQGIIVAHGTKTNGYVLYVQEGKLKLLVKQNGKEYKVESAATPARFSFSANISNSKISIDLDGKEVAQEKIPSVFNTELEGSLSTGSDNNDEKIGDYPAEFPFTGIVIQNSLLQLQKIKN